MTYYILLRITFINICFIYLYQHFNCTITKLVFISYFFKCALIYRMKKIEFFPGRRTVQFRRGPSGHLRRDPSAEAMTIKNNPSLQDKSAPQREEVVKANAHSEVLLRGGDVSDRQEVLGDYILQFGKYKGKSFRWLLENDVGYTLYLTGKVEQEENAGQFNPVGHRKDSLLSFLEYSRSFKEVEDLRRFLSERPAAPVVAREEDNLVGFGAKAQNTWGQIWKSRADGYAAFIMTTKCVPGSKMHKLKQYLLRQSQLLTTPPAPPPTVVSAPQPTVTSTMTCDLPG